LKIFTAKKRRTRRKKDKKEGISLQIFSFELFAFFAVNLLKGEP